MNHPLHLLATQLGNALIQHEKKLVTAESCTGGGVGYWLTSVGGSSAWYDRGYITYTDAAKAELLAVNPNTLDTYGAVSAETALEMASGALVNSEADVSIAITGIAGPDGATPDKPVGTVFIGIGIKNNAIETFHEQLSGSRSDIRDESIRRAMLYALKLIVSPSE